MLGLFIRPALSTITESEDQDIQSEGSDRRRLGRSVIIIGLGMVAYLSRLSSAKLCLQTKGKVAASQAWILFSFTYLH